MLAHHRSVRGCQTSARSHRAAARVPARSRRAVVTRAEVDHSLVQTGVYASLALGGLSFVGTFFVLPQFKSSLKEGVQWPKIYTYLTESKVQPALIEASDASARARKGSVLLDVRTVDKYLAGHAERACSAPLYYPIQEWDLPSILRRIGFALFGVSGTELNPDFIAQARAAVPKGREVVLLCETGGSLDNKSGSKYGFQSRSLKAAYYLIQEGYTKVSYVRGGMSSWAREGFAVEEGEDTGSSGGGGAASEQGSRSLVSAAGRLFGRGQ